MDTRIQAGAPEPGSSKVFGTAFARPSAGFSRIIYAASSAINQSFSQSKIVFKVAFTDGLSVFIYCTLFEYSDFIPKINSSAHDGANTFIPAKSRIISSPSFSYLKT